MLAMAVSAANAATYTVYKNYNDLAEIGQSNGGGELLTGADWTLSGTVTTDTSAAGYNITGGTINATGYVTISYDPGTGPTPLYQNYNVSGTATNAGVVFTSGTVCFGYAAGDCSAGTSTLDGTPSNYGLFDGTGTFGAFNSPTQGLQLLGGAGGSSFTVAQPGDLYINSPADTNLYTGGAGTFTLFGNSGAFFLGGDLQFTAVPVPAAVWLFGSALVGLVGVGRRRK